MAQIPSPGSVRNRFVLTLDGVVCGLVTSAEGGDISAPVIREPGGAFVRKRLGPAAPTPIDLSFDLSLDKTVYEWIGQSWAGKAPAKSGSVIELDPNNHATTELAFEQAVIAATTVPRMDASSKTPCVLTVRLAPTATKRRPASGPVPGLAAKPKKPWLPSNFRLAIDGLDASRVSGVDAMTISSAEKGGIDFPDLRAELAEVSSQTWSAWHDEFVVQGKNDDSHEKSGSLAFLTPDQKSELGRVTLFGLGIHGLARRPPAEGPTEVRRIVAELYCERMELAVD